MHHKGCDAYKITKNIVRIFHSKGTKESRSSFFAAILRFLIPHYQIASFNNTSSLLIPKANMVLNNTKKLT